MKRIGPLEQELVQEVLESQFRSSLGSKMSRALEERFAEIFNSKYAIAFINGTCTMHAALWAAGVRPGDEVIVPPLTMSSTSFVVLHCGAVPVFADIDARTWTITPDSIRKNITPRTKAIIPVSIYGLAPDLDEIMQIASQHNLFVLEDDAQCFLGYYKQKIVGSIGHVSSFSFQSSKHMTSGEGGMITTNDRKLAEDIRRFNSLGYAGVGAEKGKITKQDIQDPNYLRHVSLGYNYRIPELCAAVALGQLERLEELVRARQTAARAFAEVIEGHDWLVPQHVPSDYIHSYWTYAVRLAGRPGVGWRDFVGEFRKNGGDGVYGAWQLTYLEPAFRGMKFGPGQTQNLDKGLCPVAEETQPTILQFKTNYWEAEAMDRQAEALRKTIAHFEK